MAGALTATTLGGIDTVRLASLFANIYSGAVGIFLGDGADTVNIGAAVDKFGDFKKTVKIDGGAGSDNTNVLAPVNIYRAGQPVFVDVETQN